MLHTVRALKKKLTLGQIFGLILASLVLIGLGLSLLLVSQQQDLRQQASTLTRCTEDARICPDGSAVGRDPQNDCQFFTCPRVNITDLEHRCPTNNQGEITCRQQDPVICDAGQTWVPDDSPDLCGCYDGGSCVSDGTTDDTDDTDLIACTLDALECPDGSFVGRDAENDCAFRPCPDTVSPTPSPTATTTTTTDSCARDGQGAVICPQFDPIVCQAGQTAVYSEFTDECGCADDQGACVNQAVASSCYYQQVQCVTTPCHPVLVCPDDAPTTTTTADLNQDSRIDLQDYLILRQNFFSSGQNLPGDLNNDGQVNLLDFVVLRRQFSLLN